MDKQFNYTQNNSLCENSETSWEISTLQVNIKQATSKSEGKFKTCFHNPYIWYSTIYINQEEMIKKFIIQLALDFSQHSLNQRFCLNWWGPDRTRNNLDTRKSLRTKFQLTNKHLPKPSPMAQFKANKQKFQLLGHPSGGKKSTVSYILIFWGFPKHWLLSVLYQILTDPGGC